MLTGEFTLNNYDQFKRKKEKRLKNKLVKGMGIFFNPFVNI